MAKEWILNMATNRWKLNQKNSVGPVSEWIREASPKSLDEWEKEYYKRLEEKIREEENKKKKPRFLSANEYLEDLGKQLFDKIKNEIKSEVEEVTEEDCIKYIKELVIKRTFEGYETEKETVYKQLEKLLNIKIKPAPDEWDRKYNVDFYIEINNKYIGLQIKLISYKQTPQIHNWIEWLSESHEKFSQKYGGKVFLVFSFKDNSGERKIHNEEDLIKQIRAEIERLREI